MRDFVITAKAAPSARLLAQVQARMKAKKLPPEYAGPVAARVATMAAAETVIDALEQAKDLISMSKLEADKVLPMIETALDDLAGTEPDEGTEPTAHFTGRFLEAMAAQLVSAKAAGNPLTGNVKPGIGRDWNAPEARRAKMIDGLAAVIDKGHVPTIGREIAQLGSVSEIAVMVAQQAGHKPLNKAEAVRMAHTTSDFPLILENAMGKTVARRFELRQPDIVRAAHKRTQGHYHKTKTLSLSSLKRVAEVGEGGEIPYSTMDEKGEANPVLRDFGGIFSITNKAIVNDDLGMFDNVARLMTEACITVQRNVLLAPLLANGGAGQNMADGNPLFHSSHGNLAASGAALSLTTLSAARTAMRKQTGLAGELLAIEPWALVVPAELETLAQQILADIQATKTSDANPFGGQLELIVEPGLTSATAWYVIANPATYEGLTWATLEGLDAPRVESKPGWNTLGMEFRVVWALDAAFTEHATWYRNPGA